MRKIIVSIADHYEMSLLNGMLYGALLLYALHCGSSMHAGIIRDITQGTMIETCYTTYFFIKVTVGLSPTKCFTDLGKLKLQMVVWFRL